MPASAEANARSGREIRRPTCRRARPCLLGYRQHSCRNTLQGLSSSPRVPPSRPPGAGDRRGGGRPARFCQEQMHVLAEQSGSTKHDGFRVPYLSGNTPKPHSMDRPVDRAARTRTCAAGYLRAHPRGPLAQAPDDRSRSARGAPVESPGRGTRRWTLARLPRVRGTRPSGGRLGLVRAAGSASSSTNPLPPSPLQCISARIWSVPSSDRSNVGLPDSEFSEIYATGETHQAVDLSRAFLGGP